MINSEMYCGFKLVSHLSIKQGWGQSKQQLFRFSYIGIFMLKLRSQMIKCQNHFELREKTFSFLCMTVFDLFSESEFVDKFIRMLNHQTYQFAVFLSYFFLKKKEQICVSQFKSSRMITRSQRLLLILTVFFLNLLLCRCSMCSNRW